MSTVAAVGEGDLARGRRTRCGWARIERPRAGSGSCGVVGVAPKSLGEKESRAPPGTWIIAWCASEVRPVAAGEDVALVDAADAPARSVISLVTVAPRTVSASS